MAKKQQTIDIMKTGPATYKQLQAANNSGKNLSSDFIQFSNKMAQDYAPVSLFDTHANAEQDLQSNLASTKTPWGQSAFDDHTATEEQFRHLGDVRANNEPWAIKIANGLAKGAVLAGTTFLDGTVGLVFGIGQGIYNSVDGDDKTGFLDGLWNNDFSRAMKNINDASEEYLPNYYTEREQNTPWYKNIFTANFIGDKFIKNLGFSIGALYSGGVVGKVLTGAGRLSQAIGLIAESSKAPAMVNTAIGVTTAALNEARVEAINNSTDWGNLKTAEVTDYYNKDLGPFNIADSMEDNKSVYMKQMQAIQDEYEKNKGTLTNTGEGGYRDIAYDTYKSKMIALKDSYNRLQANKKKYEESLAKVNEDKLHMGNVDMLLNMPILMASDLVQFGKFFAGGFKTARQVTNIANRAGKYMTTKTALGGAAAVTKGALAEGTEEITQKMASNISGDYYGADVDNFYKAKMDPKAEQQTLSWIKATAQGINETVNDSESWEEFFIGALTGALGVPGIKRKSNGKLGIGINGGAYNEYQEYKAKMEREQGIADYLNDRVQSPEFLNYYQGLIRHTKYQDDMNKAVLDGNEFDFKNAEHAQMVSDIIMFDNAGALDDLKTLINSAYDTSDENLDAIVRNTTTIEDVDGKKQPNGPFAQFAKIEDGQIVSSFPDAQSKSDMVAKLTKNRDDIMNSINDYENTKQDLDIRTGERLTDDQLKELTWMKTQLNNWDNRTKELGEDVARAVSTLVSNGKADIDIKTALNAVLEGDEAKMSEATEALKELRVLEAISNAKADKVGMAIAADSEMGNTIKKALERVNKAHPEFTATAKYYQGISDKIDDLTKIGKAYKVYSDKLNEYLKDPQVEAADKEKAKKSMAKEANEKAASAIAERFDWSKPTSEIANMLDENKEDIDNNGGFDKFYNSLTKEQQDKVKKARRLSNAVDGLTSAVDEDEDLTDTQKRLMKSIVGKAAALAEDEKSLGDKVKEALNNGSLSEEFENSLNRNEEGVDDLAIQEAIEQSEAKLREIVDDNVGKISAALDEAEKIKNIPSDEELAAKAESLDRGDNSDLERKAAGLEGKEDRDLLAPKEEESPLTPPTEEVDNKDKGAKRPTKREDKKPAKKEITLADLKKKNKETNDKAIKNAGPIRRGQGSNYSERPQLTQTYLHGYDMQTYADYIENHPEEIPDGVDKEAYMKYIKATHKYLKEHGAFTYVSGINPEHKLSIGDEVEFIIDESLNKEAGTTAILIRAKKDNQIIGSLPSTMELNSRTKYRVFRDGKATNKYSVDKQTLAEKRPGIKALHDQIMKAYEEWSKDKTEDKGEFVGGSTKVKTLNGGILALSNNEFSVSNIFQGTGQTPIIAVADENGSLKTGTSIDDAFAEPETSVQGQVYVMIPTNKGTYLPTLAYSTKLSDLSDNDWYINEIVKAIKALPNNLLNLATATHDLYRLFNIPGLSAQIGNKGKNWTSVDNLADATYMRISYTNPRKEGEAMVQLIPLRNGELSDSNILSAIRNIIKVYPKVTTSVNTRKLTDSESDREYRNNIANYLHTNLVKGQVHTINDWFTYEPTEVEQRANNRKKVQEIKDKPEVVKGKTGAQKNEQHINVNGTQYVVDGDNVEREDGKLITNEEKQEVLNALVVKNSGAIIDLSEDNADTSKSEPNSILFGRAEETVKLSGKRSPSSRIFRPRRMDTSTTNEALSSRKKIASDIKTLRALFPDLMDNHRIVIVKGLIRTINESGNPVQAYGEFKNGVLYISSESPEGTAFHEAFHYIVTTLLNDKQRRELFNMATGKFGNIGEMAIEEKLAEEFRAYMNGYRNSSIKNIILKYFNALKRIVKSIANNSVNADNLFYELYKDNYKGISTVSDDFHTRLLEYKTKKLAFANLDSETKNYLSLRGYSEAEYEDLSNDSKELLLKCM